MFSYYLDLFSVFIGDVLPCAWVFMTSMVAFL